MTIFLSKKVIGYDRNITITGDSVTFTHDEPGIGMWHLDDAAWLSLKRVSDASGIRLRSEPDDTRIEWWKNFNIPVRYDHVLGREKFLTYIKNLIADCKEIASGENYFTGQFQVQNRLLDSLQPAFVDRNAVRQIESHDVTSLESDDTGKCLTAIYDNVSSSTGRMSIKHGPRILTMSKEVRHVFKSAWNDDGTLLSVDFNALEPRVIMTVMGKKNLPADIYSMIGNDIGANDIDRTILKTMIISTLYGMTRRNFILKFIDTKDADCIYDNLQRVLGVKGIFSKIKNDMCGDTFKNHFGRPLKCENESLYVNHFTQSTAVDVACDGFLKFIEDCKSFVRPVFLLHDELIVDIKNDDLDRVKEYLTGGLYIPSLDSNFHVKTKVFNARKNR